MRKFKKIAKDHKKEVLEHQLNGINQKINQLRADETKVLDNIDNYFKELEKVKRHQDNKTCK